MGYDRHNAIIVTASSDDRIEEAHRKALELFLPVQRGCRDFRAAVTEITPDTLNGYRSFLVAPDGSKEGWPESDAGDEARATFVEWLHAQAFDDGSSPLAWVEVQYGDDELETKVIHDSDERQRGKRTRGTVGDRVLVEEEVTL